MDAGLRCNGMLQYAIARDSWGAVGVWCFDERNVLSSRRAAPSIDTFLPAAACLLLNRHGALNERGSRGHPIATTDLREDVWRGEPCGLEFR